MEGYGIQEVNGKTRVCGLIADPVSHTMSPILHNTISTMMGINEIYVPFSVPLPQLREALQGAYSMNVLGLNASIPHKSEVIPYLKSIDPVARDIGAVNTMVRTEDGYRGYNTDYSGLWRTLKEEDIQIQGRPAAVLGAGGAAKSAAYLLARENCSHIYILNRTLERAAYLRKDIQSIFPQVDITALSLTDWNKIKEDHLLALQTTSVGMSQNAAHAVIEDPAFYSLVSEAFDMVYIPWRTRFMQLVEQSGGRSLNGLRMLLYQGVDAYELWNQVSVPASVLDQAYTNMKEILLGQKG